MVMVAAAAAAGGARGGAAPPAGYSEGDLSKIAGRNHLRAMRGMEAAAKEETRE